MNEDQQNLASAIEQQSKLISEINELNTQINVRKESALKLQGIIEYLQAKGVTLPESEPTQEETEVQEETEAP
jgi:hypothetical protein